jgi:glycosyltransferase involved in cell wall biosynthesis
MEIFVLPSLYEGFGIAILEAMAAGKPVVASTVGGIPEFVVPGESGLLVPPGDSVALAAAIRQLLAQPEQAKAMGGRGQEHVRKHYSMESVVRQHEQLYEICAAQTSSLAAA